MSGQCQRERRLKPQCVISGVVWFDGDRDRRFAHTGMRRGEIFNLKWLIWTSISVIQCEKQKTKLSREVPEKPASSTHVKTTRECPEQWRPPGPRCDMFTLAGRREPEIPRGVLTLPIRCCRSGKRRTVSQTDVTTAATNVIRDSEVGDSKVGGSQANVIGNPKVGRNRKA